jgi:hypothetical protein
MTFNNGTQEGHTMASGKWKTLSVSVLLFFCFLTAALGQAQPSLIGAWQSAGPGGPIHLVFESKNRLIFDGEPAKYALSPGLIRVDDGQSVINYPYILSGDLLTITFPEGFKMQFKRTKGAPAPSAKTGNTGSSSAEVESSKLASEIAGVWWGYSGSTERKIGLCPNGRYQDYSESSYSGSSKDSLGNPSTSWGAAGQRGGSGTWTIKGSYQEGIISVHYSNGNVTTIQYKQFGDPGCLLFNGNKLCRSGRCN